MLCFDEARGEAAVINLASHFRSDAADQRGIDFDGRNYFFMCDGFESRHYALHGAVVGLYREGQCRALTTQLLIEQVLIRLRYRSEGGDTPVARQHHGERSQRET